MSGSERTMVTGVVSGGFVTLATLACAAWVLESMSTVREWWMHQGEMDFSMGTDVPGILSEGGWSSFLLLLAGALLAPLCGVLAARSLRAGPSSGAVGRRGLALVALGLTLLLTGVLAFEVRMHEAELSLTTAMGPGWIADMLTISRGGNLSNVFFALVSAAIPLGLGTNLLVVARARARTSPG